MFARTKAHAATPSLEQTLQVYIESTLAPQLAGIGARVEIKIGTIDPRLALAQCERIEPYLPGGARLWGRAHVGMRCVDGTSRWNVFLPVEIKVYGPALVAARPLASGQPITPADIRLEEVELTREPAGVIADPALLEAKVASRALQPGTVLRSDQFRSKSVIVMGDQVKVVFIGEGFTIASEGKALMAAADGQQVRIQMESGRVVSGTARDGRKVELR
jgi:flagellar basal body P-ring formation protein FlgA